MTSKTLTLEVLEFRYDQVLNELDDLLGKIESTIISNKPTVIPVPIAATKQDGNAQPNPMESASTETV